ncbi:MAG: hypothetical protein ACOX4U_00405 [Anaerovoracaceae bacterium]
MINVKDRVVEHPHRYKLTNISGDTYDLSREPGTVTEEGTVVNRALLMAMQGFVGATTVFGEDGTITETNAEGGVLVTTFEEDGSVIETFTAGGVSIAKQTSFGEDGSIEEVML